MKSLALPLLFVCGLSAQVHWTNDRTVYPYPPLPTLPPRGQSFTDPTFGTAITRVTDASDGDLCFNAYPEWAALNSNSTQLYFTCTHKAGGNGLPYDTQDYYVYDYDPSSMTVTGRSVINQVTPSGSSISWEWAHWSGSNPNVIYFADRLFNLWAYNTRTKAYALLKNFSAEIPANGYFSRMSMSQDNDNYFAFAVGDTTDGNRWLKFFVWQRDTDKIIFTRLPDVQHDLYKVIKLSKDGRYAICMYFLSSYRGGQPHLGELSEETYDLSVAPPVVVRSLWDTSPNTGTSHWDAGRAFTVGWSPWFNQDISKQYTGPTDQRKVLFDYGTDWRLGDKHDSFRNRDESFFVSSTYDSPGTVPPSVGLFHNEIVAFATDGSGNFQRICHHRSVYNTYYAAPHASVSIDGRFVAFTSNWGGSVRSDVFITRIGTGAVAPSIVSPLPPGMVGRIYSQALAATGATPTTWSISSGTLPVGLTLDSAGVIKGTPAAAGTSTFTLRAANAAGSDNRQFSLTSNPVLPVTCPAVLTMNPQGDSGPGAFTFTVLAENCKQITK